MKAVSLFVVVSLMLMTFACRRADEIVDSFTHFSFEADYVLQVPASPVTTVPLEILTPDIQTHSDALFVANKTNADHVEEIKLTELMLTVKTPKDGDFKFLKSVDIYAKAYGLPDVRVAYKDLVPDDVGGKIALDVTGVDLTEYFKKKTYQLKITVTSDQVLTNDYLVNAHSKFFVDAKVLGQ